MSRFETIEQDFWSRKPFCELTSSAKLVYVWTRTNPACVMSGIYRARVEQIALDTSLEHDDVSQALGELEREGVVRIDEDGLLWVCDRVKWLRSRNPGIAKSIARDVAELGPAHPFRAAFLDRYGQDPWLREELRPLVAETVGGPSPNGSQTVSDSPVAEGNPGTVPGPSPDGHLHLHVHGASGISTTDSRARTREGDEEALWAHYLATIYPADRAGPRPTFDAVRRTIVADALATRDVEHCKLAITGLAKSPHHRGENDHGTPYQDIRYALRGNARGESNEERIDRMAALATAPRRIGGQVHLTSEQLVAADAARRKQQHEEWDRDFPEYEDMEQNE